MEVKLKDGTVETLTQDQITALTLMAWGYTQQEAATVVGKHRNTMREWWKRYRRVFIPEAEDKTVELARAAMKTLVGPAIRRTAQFITEPGPLQSPQSFASSKMVLTNAGVVTESLNINDDRRKPSDNLESELIGIIGRRAKEGTGDNGGTQTEGA